MVGLSVPGDVVVRANAYMLDKTNGASLVTIALGHSLDTLNHVLGEFADLWAVSAPHQCRSDRRADRENGGRPGRGDRHPHVRGDR
jgi:hypothetical protein